MQGKDWEENAKSLCCCIQNLVLGTLLSPPCPDEHPALIVIAWLGKKLLFFNCKDSMAAE